MDETSFSKPKADRSFSLWGAVKKFGLGLISPITGLFSSPGAFVGGVLTFAALGALCVAAPAFGSVMVTGGLLLGGYQAVKALGQIATAKDGKDVENAFEEVGAATSTLGLTVATGRMALKGTGMPAAAEAGNMGMLEATWANVRNTPAAIVEGFSTLFSGRSIANLRAVWAAIRGAEEAAPVIDAVVDGTKSPKRVPPVLEDAPGTSSRIGPPSGTEPIILDPPPRTVTLPDPVPSQPIPRLLQGYLDKGDVAMLQRIHKLPTTSPSSKLAIETRLAELGAPLEAGAEATTAAVQLPKSRGPGRCELPTVDYVGEVAQLAKQPGPGQHMVAEVFVPGKGSIRISTSADGQTMFVVSDKQATAVQAGGRSIPSQPPSEWVQSSTRLPVTPGEEVVILAQDGYQLKVMPDGKIIRQPIPDGIKPPTLTEPQPLATSKTPIQLVTGEYELPMAEFVGEIGQINMTGTGMGGHMTIKIPGKGDITISRSNINGANVTVESADIAVKVRPGGRAMPNEATIKLHTRVPATPGEEIMILAEDGYQIKIAPDGKVSRQLLPSDVSPPRRLGLKTIGDYKMAPYEEFVGETYITNKATGERVNVMVVRSNTSKGGEVYKIIRPDGRELGYTDIRVCTEGPLGHGDFLADVAWYREHGYCGSSSWGKYGHSNDVTYSPRVYVEMMKSPASGTYRGVGERLHQLAVERSLQIGGEGRVTLSASYNSHGFHYKTGFRTQSPNVAYALGNDEKIAAILADAKLRGVRPDTSELAQFGMYLPEEGVNAMKVRIKGGQILEDVGPLVPADWTPPVVTVKTPPTTVLNNAPAADRPVIPRGRNRFVSPDLQRQVELGRGSGKPVKGGNGGRRGVPNGNRSPYGPDGVGATSRRVDPVKKAPVQVQEKPATVQANTTIADPPPQVVIQDPPPQAILADTTAQLPPQNLVTTGAEMADVVPTVPKPRGNKLVSPALRRQLEGGRVSRKGGNTGRDGVPVGNRSPYGPNGRNATSRRPDPLPSRGKKVPVSTEQKPAAAQVNVTVADPPPQVVIQEPPTTVLADSQGVILADQPTTLLAAQTSGPTTLYEPPVLKALIADLPPTQPQVVLVEPRQVLPGTTSRTIPLVDRPVIPRGRGRFISSELRQQFEAGSGTGKRVKGGGGGRNGVPAGNRSPYGPDGVGATSRRPDPLPSTRKTTARATTVKQEPLPTPPDTVVADTPAVIIQDPPPAAVVQDALPQTVLADPPPQVIVTEAPPQPLQQTTSSGGKKPMPQW